MYPTKYRSCGIPSAVNVAFDNEMLRDFMSPSFRQNRMASPAANVKENKENFLVDLIAPGRSKEDFQLQVEGKNLVITSEKTESTSSEDETMSRREFQLSSFTRTFVLPENVDQEKISATYTNGILSITLPKKTATVRESAREISVQ